MVVLSASLFAFLLCIVFVRKGQKPREAPRGQGIFLAFCWAVGGAGFMFDVVQTAARSGEIRWVQMAVAFFWWCGALLQAYQAGRKSWQTKS